MFPIVDWSHTAAKLAAISPEITPYGIPAAGGRPRSTMGKPPMMVIVFRARRTPEGDGEEYSHWLARMSELARKMPGYISHKGYVAEDGERLTIVEFESEEAQRAWSMHAEHAEAKKKGRSTFYEEYRIQVCTVQRESSFPKRAG